MFKFISVLFIFFLTACGGSAAPPMADNDTSTGSDDGGSQTGGGDNSSRVTISLIQMNDLHANLVTHSEVFRIDGKSNLNVEMAGGIAKMASKIKQIRQSNPENSLLMNIGDTFHGGGEALFTNGNAIVEAVNELNIDVGVIGNWDYAYGPIITNARFGNLSNLSVTRPNFPLLAANVSYRIPPQMVGNPVAENLVQNAFNYQAGTPFLPSSHIFEREGVKIGFIGLTSDIIEFMHPFMAFNLEFTQGKDDYLTLLEFESQQLKQQDVDIIVVMSELGLQKDWELAKSLPEGNIDFIFSAHTHEVTEEMLISPSGIVVVEAGNDSYLGQMDIIVENGQIVEKNWQLHRLDSTVEADPDMLSLVAEIRAPMLVESPNISVPVVILGFAALEDQFPRPVSPILRFGLEQPLADTTLALYRKNSLENRFSDWFTDRLRQEMGTDIAMTSGFRFDSVIVPSLDNFSGESSDYVWQSETPEIFDGKINVADAYRFFPAPFNLAKANVSVAQLKLIIESNLQAVYSNEVFEQRGGWTDGYSGLELVVELTADNGERVQFLILSNENEVADDSRIISVAGCARPFDLSAETTLCAYQGFSEVETIINPMTGEAYIAADFLIDSLQSNDINDSSEQSRQSIQDNSNFPQWPVSPYYQPLEGAVEQ